MWFTGRRSRGWLERVNSVLAQVTKATPTPVRAASRLIELPHLERAVALAAVALSEHTPVVVLDQVDTFASTEDEVAFLSAIHLLAPATTTLVVGSPIPQRARTAPAIGDRELVNIDLYSLALAGAAKGGTK
jgi:putative drug exporter of the RND superfamily